MINVWPEFIQTENQDLSIQFYPSSIKVETKKEQRPVNKSWRVDFGWWERKEGGRWVYTKWHNGKTKTMRHRNRRNRASAKVMTGPDEILMNAAWSMGRSEFENGECKGNKWLVPVNRVLRIDLP